MAMKTPIQKTDFSFKCLGYGVYRVTYTSPVTGKRWTADTADMTLIDATKNADEPRNCDLEWLKYVCKHK